MVNDQSLHLFKCPSCGAPLDPEKGASSMKCPYCGASIVIPESLRTPASSSASLSDVTRLAKEGKLDEAAKIYSKITGLSHENAMFSVKSMAGIREDETPVSNNPYSYSQPQASSTYQSPLPSQPVYTAPRVRVRNSSCLSAVVRLVIVFAILSTAFPAIIKALQFKLPFELPFNLPFTSGDNPASVLPTPFATEVMSFDPGSFQDPRAIGVDGNGNIVVCDFDGGQIQVFDPDGNFISGFTPEGNGNDLYITSMAVTGDGIIYIPANTILKYNENGEKLGEVSNGSFFYYHVALGPNDTLYAMTNEAIIRFDQNGQVDLEIPTETLEQLTGSPSGSGQIAVDAQGNIYFWGSFDATILKFSPQGEYLSRFGGEDNNSGDFTPGKFVNPHQIAFDSFGRIYVVDFFYIQVFDSNLAYIDRIEGGHYGVAFDPQNYLYATTSVNKQVVKYEVKQPNE